ncbi:MAG: transcriptional regulator, partial [Acidobacteriota bacterium]
MDSHDPPRRRIGDYDFDPDTGQLDHRDPSGEPGRRLEPKVAALLELLAGRPGELVTKEEVTASLWPDVVVGEDALPRCLSKLRRALGDDAKAPRYVETVPKRGYRLVAAVAQPDRAIEAPGAVESTAPPQQRPAASTGSRSRGPLLLGLVAGAL